MFEQIKLNIQRQEDIENIIIALANSGYKVWVEEEPDKYYLSKKLLVVFEIENGNKEAKTLKDLVNNKN